MINLEGKLIIFSSFFNRIRNALMLAIVHNHPNIVQFLMTDDDVNINHRDNFNNT